jgi:hypothetical protein
MRIVARDLFVENSRPSLGLTQSPIQWIPKALALEVERLGREAVGVKIEPPCGSWLV